MIAGIRDHILKDKFLHYMLYPFGVLFIYLFYFDVFMEERPGNLWVILIIDIIGLVLWVIRLFAKLFIYSNPDDFPEEDIIDYKLIGLRIFNFYWSWTMIGFIIFVLWYRSSYLQNIPLIIIAFNELGIRVLGSGMCDDLKKIYLPTKIVPKDLNLEHIQSTRAIFIHNLIEGRRFEIPKYAGDIAIQDREFFLEEDTLREHLIEDSARAFKKEKILMFCYLITAASQEELDTTLKEIYEKSFAEKENRLTSIVLVIRLRYSYKSAYSMPTKYENYRGFQYFDTTYETAIQPERLWNTYFKTEQADVPLFSEPYKLLQLLPTDQPNCFADGIGERDTYEFLHSALLMHSINQSVMALLDYSELILRCAAYYCYIREQKVIEEYIRVHGLHINRYGKEIDYDEVLTTADLQTLGQIIHAAAAKRDQLFPSVLDYQIELEDTTKKIFSALDQYIKFDFNTETVSFIDLCNITRQVKNRIAHASLEDENEYIIWSFLAYDMLLLSNYLNIDEFHVHLKDNKIYCGYYTEAYYAGQFFKLKDHHICLLHNIRNSSSKKQCEFINYFDGDLIIPSIYEESDII